MRERVRFVSDVSRGEQAVGELCERYGISRKAGYKWLQRFAEEGPLGLVDRSRCPHRRPNTTRWSVVEALEELGSFSAVQSPVGDRPHIRYGYTDRAEVPDRRLNLLDGQRKASVASSRQHLRISRRNELEAHTV
jgi:transposase-like protein